MRTFCLLALLLLIHPPITLAQENNEHPQADPSDVSSVDAIINASYEVISGPIGQPRQLERNLSLFHPTARLTHTEWLPGGERAALVHASVEDHARQSYLVEHGFEEKEIGRDVVSYGTVTHVFSTYEYTTEDGSMSGRGINSFQLYFDGTRYWIMSIMWSQESPEHPIPDKFIGKE